MPHVTHYKSIFISDIHLGTRGCQADALCVFLKTHTCENLFLVGDILDGWRMQKRWYFPQSHANVIRRILTKAKRNTNVYYLLGNHDEALRQFLKFDISFGDIQILDRMDYEATNGKRYLVIHGDFFDVLMRDKKWLMHLGDAAYDAMIWFNIQFNKVRGLFGLKYWSLSKWLKHNAKKAVKFINRYEEYVAEYCENHGYEGIVCGHIHFAEKRMIGNVEYMNTGDWVESATALLEHVDGTFEIYYHEEENINSNRQSAGTD